VRAGFHRTTMQDVAAEAAMSPGNLYRYFPSKDAIAIGLAERDRARVSEDFAQAGKADDFLAALTKLGRKHFIDEPRERAILCLQIWAEATRNPVFATMTEEFDRDVSERMTHLFRQAQQRGVISPNVDPAATAAVVSVLANGLFVRRAVAADFDAEREVSYVIEVVKAMLRGDVDLNRSAPAGAPS